MKTFSQVACQVWFHIEKQTWNQVWNHSGRVLYQVAGHVRSQVFNQVRARVCIKYLKFNMHKEINETTVMD